MSLNFETSDKRASRGENKSLLEVVSLPILYGKPKQDSTGNANARDNSQMNNDTTILQDAVLDFLLSRRAKNCTPKTVEWYRYSLDRLKVFFEKMGITRPEQITRLHINRFICDLQNNDCAASYIHGYARVVKTFLRFMVKENYINEYVEFDMPILKNRRQTVYTETEVQEILKACSSKRSLAFIKLMVDSGIRLAEMLSLNWCDVDLNSGIIRIENGKGGKFRTVVIGVDALRALIKYKTTIDSPADRPVFQTIHGRRFSESGLRSWLNRLSKRAGVHITPHALRRTFATLALRAGMDLIRLQQLMGHSELETTRRYIQVLDEDLITAHRNHSPLEFALRGKMK